MEYLSGRLHSLLARYHSLAKNGIRPHKNPRRYAVNRPNTQKTPNRGGCKKYSTYGIGQPRPTHQVAGNISRIGMHRQNLAKRVTSAKLMISQNTVRPYQSHLPQPQQHPNHTNGIPRHYRQEKRPRKQKVSPKKYEID